MVVVQLTVLPFKRYYKRFTSNRTPVHCICVSNQCKDTTNPDRQIEDSTPLHHDGKSLAPDAPRSTHRIWAVLVACQTLATIRHRANESNRSWLQNLHLTVVSSPRVTLSIPSSPNNPQKQHRTCPILPASLHRGIFGEHPC